MLLLAAIVAAAALLMAVVPGAHAASGAAPISVSSFATPAHQALPSAAGGVVRVTIALIIVLAAVFGAAWLQRRLHGATGARHGGLEVLAQLSLGPRERAVLVRVGAQQLLLGVASGSVRMLHVVDAANLSAELPVGGGTDSGLTAPTAGMQRPSFRSLLLRSLGK